MKRPDADALDLASDWCESYEPGAEDAIELSAVANWLRWQAEEARNNDYDDHDADDVKNIHCLLRIEPSVISI